MVRERLGDWRAVWRITLAGLLASLLVVAMSQTTVVAPLCFALQDGLFLVPAPSPQVTLVAFGSAAAETFRLLKVTASRQDRSSPWPPLPTDMASAAYSFLRVTGATR